MTENPNDPNRKRTTGMANPEYRAARRKKKTPFNFELESERREQLRNVADARGISMGAVLRQLVTAAHGMEILGAAACVNGRPCFVPHMQPPINSPTTTQEPTP